MLWDLIFTLTWHAVFTDVLWPSMINATVQHVSVGSRSSKNLPFIQIVSPTLTCAITGDWARGRTAAKKKSPPGVLPGVGVTCDGYRLCRAVAALWPWAKLIPTFLQRARQRVCMDMAPSFGFSAQQPQWCTFKIITRVRALSREGHPWCRLLIASGRIRGYVSKWKWCNVTSVRVDWRAFICKKRKALNWKMKGQDGPSFCWRENINSEVGSARWVKSGGWGWTAHISLNAIRPNLTYGPVTERRPSELLLYLLGL